MPSRGSARAASPGRQAARRLARDRGAVAAVAVLLLIVAACLAAPLYDRFVSGTDPFRSDPNGTVTVDGRRAELIAENPGLGTTPLGPTWRGPFFLGADTQGRDVAARLLHGGRVSLLIAGSAAVITLALAGLLGVVAGYAGGRVDAALSALLDLLWAFPVYLLAISLSVVLIGGDLRLGPLLIGADSLLLPILILGVVYVPYVARPVRAEVVALGQREYVQAAVAVGASPAHVLRRHLLPGVLGTLAVFAPTVAAIDLLTEAALSVLSIGVQAPAASWGTLIGDGQTLIYARPLVAIAPGGAVAVTALAMNLLGEAARDALDPRARPREG